MARVGRMVKESMVKTLETELAERPSFFVTRVNRLTAVEADGLRQKLYASKAKLIVMQRKLGQRVLEPLKIPGLADLLEGSVGLVLPSEDVLPAAKLIVDFIKTHEDQLAVRGGVVDGQLLDKSHVEQLASLSPKPMLLAQVVATIESPLADVIFTLERLIGDLAWLAEQAAATRPAEAKPAAAAETLPPTTATPAPPGEPTPPAAPAAPTGTPPPPTT